MFEESELEIAILIESLHVAVMANENVLLMRHHASICVVRSSTTKEFSIIQYAS